MLHQAPYKCCVFFFTLSLLLPVNTQASTHVLTSTGQPVSFADFPVVDPLYIYNQLSYLTTSFQSREAGYVSNQGHDRFAAYWSQEMVKNLQGFGPQVRRDEFPIHGWRERVATLPAFNMEISVPGVTHPEQEVVLGCHYDGKADSTQSAFDDTSGCAYELGVGKAMGDYWRSHHVYPARTVRFVIFDAEEQGLFGSFHYLNSSISGDLQNVVAMFNEEQSGINYPARFLGKLSNPFMPDYINVTPLQDNAAYPGRIHLSPTQRQHVMRFRALWQQAIPAVFAQFQAAGYSSLYYYDHSSQNTSQPIFSAGQLNNVHIQDDPSSNSDQVPFIYAGLPVVTLTGDQTYYDPNPPPWAFPYDLPVDTLQMMNTYVSGTTRPAPALALGLALPAMFTTWMLNQPDMLGQASSDGNPIAAISDVGQTQVGRSISLDAKASFDPHNSSYPLTYAWNFGDGTTASGVSVSHTYKTVGNYTLTLSVTSPGGKRVISKTINASTAPDIYSNPYSPLGGINRPNPAVTIPVPDNNLPEQPPLAPPVLTPTSTVLTPAPAAGTAGVSTTAPSTHKTDTIGGSLPILFIAITILIISILVLIAALIVRMRRS
jgi:PKD domain-containing protein/peptidase M28-like protein